MYTTDWHMDKHKRNEQRTFSCSCPASGCSNQTCKTTNGTSAKASNIQDWTFNNEETCAQIRPARQQAEQACWTQWHSRLNIFIMSKYMLKSDLQDIKQNKCSTQQHSRLNIFIMRKYVLKSDRQDNKPNKCSTQQHKKGVKVCVRMCACMFFGHCVLERRRCECNIFDSTGIL